MIYRAALDVDGKTLFLRYVEKMIFTDCVGYVWKKMHLLNKVLPDIKKVYPNVYVHEISDEEYDKIKNNSSKATIIFPYSKRGRKSKEESQQQNQHISNPVKPEKEVYNYTKHLHTFETDPDLIEEDVDENALFKKLNLHCIKCKRACKQSWLAMIVRCDQFTPVNA